LTSKVKIQIDYRTCIQGNEIAKFTTVLPTSLRLGIANHHKCKLYAPSEVDMKEGKSFIIIDSLRHIPWMDLQQISEQEAACSPEIYEHSLESYTEQPLFSGEKRAKS